MIQTPKPERAGGEGGDLVKQREPLKSFRLLPKHAYSSNNEAASTRGVAALVQLVLEFPDHMRFRSSRRIVEQSDSHAIPERAA